MEMSVRQLISMLEATVREIQEQSGEEPIAISPKTVPLRQLPGFDSFRVLEVLCALEEKLNQKISDENLFVSEDTARLLSIEEVAGRIHAIDLKSLGGNRAGK